MEEENLGNWDNTEDHPDFDPNLLNVESWNVDHQSDDVQIHVDPHDPSGGRQRKKSWGDSGRQTAIDQWSANLGVPDFDPAHHSQPQVGNPSQPQVSIKRESSNAAVVGNHPAAANNATGSNLHRVVGIPTETVETAVEAAVAAISEPADSVNTGDQSVGSSTNNPSRMTQHLHPLGIQSSASCPAPAHPSGLAFHQQQPQQIQQGQPVPLLNHHHQPGQQQQQPQQQHTIPASSTTATTAPTSAQHLTSLQANFILAQAANSTVAATAAAAAAAGAGATNPATVISQPSTKAPAPTRRRGGTRAKVTPASKSTKKKKDTAGHGSVAGATATGDATSTAAAAAAASSTLPPFYLFDAPIELRANFMQNQRRLGLPIQHDPNSYHYGETVNGFHPHQYQIPVGANASTAAGTAASGNVLRPANLPPLQLIDARHANHRKAKGGQVKNEREQKRAQKITELIEQLRLQMEDGGWQVEARSKFHTLSNCAQYIKHMISLTKEKETQNSKLNEELDEKRRKLEREKEEKAMQEGRSDPESVTSSLTSDTTMSTARHKQEEEGGNDESKKRKLQDTGNNGGGSSGDDSNQNSSNNDAENKTSNKKHRISSEAPTEDSSGDDNRGGSGTGSGSGNSRTGSGTGSGSGSGSGSGGSGSAGISKTISSVSELTDSNRGSSSNNSGSGGGSSDDLPTEQDSNESNSGNREEAAADQPSTSSISSDAAVASEKTSRDRNTGHKDVVFNNKSRKRPPEEVTSLERTFELNYEEVFHKSNIPQLIASTSGKIVTWNECFCKATGYRKSEIERMTIFSLVKPENLANFFEIVAAALRPDDEVVAKETVAETKSSDEKKDDEEKKETEESSASNNSASTKSDSKQNLVTESASSSQHSLSGHDTVICSNNEKDGVKQDTENHDTGAVEENEVEKPVSENVDVSENPTNTESSSNSTEEYATSDKCNDESSSNSTEEKMGKEAVTSTSEEGSNSTEGEGNNKTDSDNVSGTSTNEEVSSNSTEDNDSGTQNEEDVTAKAQEGATNSKEMNEEEKKPEDNDAMDIDQSEKGSEELMTKRLLNYTAMTLPCIDFPAMIKRNQAAHEENAALIPPLHVTVTLMSDKDPRRRCFHCVFTNSKGTNGSLGIITPELLASLFSTPLRTNRRKKSTHQHQRKRSRGGTTRVGQSVSMASNKKEQDKKHSVQHIVSTNNEGEAPPSPLLMPPPGPPAEETAKKEGEKAMQVDATN